MAAGHYGEHGLRAQRLVGLEAKHVTEPVPIPRQSMEECALDRVFKQRLVRSKIALLMAVGAPGANGVHALKRVALENNIAVGTATNQHQRMEENTVLVNIKSQGTAIQTLAQ